MGVTDVGKAVLLLFIPAVPELGLPGEGLGALHLQEAAVRRSQTRPGRPSVPPPGPTSTPVLPPPERILLRSGPPMGWLLPLLPRAES